MKKGWAYAFVFIILIDSIILVSSVNLDLNHDGSINIQDLQLLVSHYEGRTSYNSSFDLNNDSKVDLFDVVAEARQINNSINQGNSNSSNNNSNSSLYPNMPSGMTTLYEVNGTVATAGGHAFGLTDWGNWIWEGPNSSITSISDPTNPLGTGKVLRFDYGTASTYGTGGAGVSQNWNFSKGTFLRLYVMIRVYIEPGFFNQEGMKFFYWGNPSAGLTPWYVQANTGQIDLADQYQTGTYIVHGTSNTLTTGVWHNIEILVTAESSPGAGDGQAKLWVDGVLQGTTNTEKWLSSSDSPNGFNSMEWYASMNHIYTTDRGAYRLGEFYVAGSN